MHLRTRRRTENIDKELKNPVELCSCWTSCLFAIGESIILLPYRAIPPVSHYPVQASPLHHCPIMVSRSKIRISTCRSVSQSCLFKRSHDYISNGIQDRQLLTFAAQDSMSHPLFEIRSVCCVTWARSLVLSGSGCCGTPLQTWITWRIHLWIVCSAHGLSRGL